MGDPHNSNRYGEAWDQYKIDAYQEVLDALKPYDSIILSGGWAWHFLSPPGHPEYKHAHDHKDLDIFTLPIHAAFVVDLLKGLGFEKIHTKYDRLPSSEEFRRYEKWGKVDIEVPEEDLTLSDVHFRLTIDFFVKDLPWVKLPSGWVVVEPRTLLSMYSSIHSSDKAWCVQAAAKVFDNPGASLADLTKALAAVYQNDFGKGK